MIGLGIDLQFFDHFGAHGFGINAICIHQKAFDCSVRADRIKNSAVVGVGHAFEPVYGVDVEFVGRELTLQIGAFDPVGMKVEVAGIAILLQRSDGLGEGVECFHGAKIRNMSALHFMGMEGERPCSVFHWEGVALS